MAVKDQEGGRRTPKQESVGRECDQCGQTFKYRCRLMEHLMKHNGEKPSQV